MTHVTAGQIQLSDAIDLGVATLACNNRPEGWRVAEFDTLIAYDEGERYAGIVIDSATGQPTHHLILLPSEAKSITWPDALTWAEQAGGALPTRQEQALLYANLKPHFKGAWCWSSEQHAGYEGCAWIQDFNEGTQYLSGKGYKRRARAVRRVPITEN